MKTKNKIKLSFIEEKILSNLSALLSERIKEANALILFGSRAKGSSNENSDLDIAVLLNTLKIRKEHWQMVWDAKWKVLESLKAEEFPLSLILTTTKNFKMGFSSLEKELKKEGVVIWKRN